MTFVHRGSRVHILYFVCDRQFLLSYAAIVIRMVHNRLSRLNQPIRGVSARLFSSCEFPRALPGIIGNSNPLPVAFDWYWPWELAVGLIRYNSYHPHRNSRSTKFACMHYHQARFPTIVPFSTLYDMYMYISVVVPLCFTRIVGNPFHDIVPHFLGLCVFCQLDTSYYAKQPPRSRDIIIIVNAYRAMLHREFLMHDRARYCT